MQANAFEIEVNAPYSLNYMVFLQNVYLNQNRYQEDRQVFPYVDSRNGDYWVMFNLLMPLRKYGKLCFKKT